MTHDIQGAVHAITYRPKDRLKLFEALPIGERSAVFAQLSPRVSAQLLEHLSTEDIVDLLDHLDPRSAEMVLARVRDHAKRTRIATRLSTDLKDKAEYFLRFHPKAALHLLNFNYLLLPHTATIGEAADAIDEHYTEVGKLPEVLVHENGRCIGEIGFSQLVRESNDEPLADHLTPVATVRYQAELPEVMEIFSAEKRGKVVVLDTDDSVVGIIYADEALRLFGDAPASSLYDFAGVTESERISDGIWTKVRRRYKWLILNLATAFLAAFTVNLFEDTLSALVVLAIYIPLVAGMGSNAATQTLAVTVRGITLGEVRLRNAWKPIRNEIAAGAINGLITGAIVILVATIWNANPLLGVVVALATIANLAVAGFVGAFMPLFMKSIGKDPATSAIIFITTVTDVFGFVTFLGLATLILL